MPNKKRYKDMAFVIMPSGKNKEYEGSILNSEQIYQQIICHGIKKADNSLIPDLEVLNLKSSNIPSSIIEKLNYARLVVADLTGANPNVTFELGVRWRARSKCTILISQNPAKNPFDIAHYRALDYNPKNIKASVNKITRAIKETLKTDDPDSGVYDSLPELPIFSSALERFWEPFLLKKVNVIIGSIPVLTTRGDMVADFVAESIHSANHIISTLHLLNQFDVQLLAQHIDHSKILDGLKDNLIFIGSRHSHPIGGEKLKRPYFKFDHEFKNNKPIIYKNNKKIGFKVTRNEGYGTIHKVNSLFDRRSSLLVLSGNLRYSSLAATRAVCGESQELLSKAGYSNFETLFKAELIHNPLIPNQIQPMPIRIFDFVLR